VRLILETWTTGYSIPSPALDLAADRAAALYDGAVRDDAVRSGRVGGRAYFAPTAVRPGLSAREAGVTPALARPHDQVYFHLPLSIAPFVWRPRTSPSHGENRGSSPLGSANKIKYLIDISGARFGSYGKSTEWMILNCGECRRMYSSHGAKPLSGSGVWIVCDGTGRRVHQFSTRGRRGGAGARGRRQGGSIGVVICSRSAGA
jgi:hypothetical protein